MKLDFRPDEWERFHARCWFTDEQKHIIELRRRGWKYSDIAAELYLSERQLYRKLNSIVNKIVALG